MFSRRAFFRKSAVAVPGAAIGATLLSRTPARSREVALSMPTSSGGSGATAKAIVVDGQVVGIVVTDPGRNYTSIPTVRFM